MSAQAGKRKILIVALRGPTNAQRRGGSQDYILNIAAPWVEDGHQVEILCGQERVADLLLPSQEIVHGVSVRRVGTPSNRVRPILRATRSSVGSFDLVIENITGFPLMLPLCLPRRTRFMAIKHHFEGRTYFSTQGPLKGAYGIFLEEIVQPLIYRDVPFVTVSAKTDRELRGKWIKPRGALAIVSPGLAEELRDVPAQLSRSETPTVLYLGALNLGRKRVDHLIQAFAAVLPKIPGAQLIIGGRGPHEQQLRRAAQGLPVHFQGFLSEDEKRRLLAGAWVFASPSQSEGFGITWVEANAFGLPVVGYELGLDTVNESCARMVPRGNVAALAGALIEVLGNARLRQDMQVAAYANARRFDWRTSSARFMEFIRYNC